MVVYLLQLLNKYSVKKQTNKETIIAIKKLLKIYVYIKYNVKMLRSSSYFKMI